MAIALWLTVHLLCPPGPGAAVHMAPAGWRGYLRTHCILAQMCQQEGARLTLERGLQSKPLAQLTSVF